MAEPIYVTLHELHELGPCGEGYKHLMRALDRPDKGDVPAEDVHIPLMTILEKQRGRGLDPKRENYPSDQVAKKADYRRHVHLWDVDFAIDCLPPKLYDSEIAWEAKEYIENKDEAELIATLEDWTRE